MDYLPENQMEKPLSVKKLLIIALAIPLAAAIFYVLLQSVVYIGEQLEQYIGVAGYIVAIVIVVAIANLFCRAIVRPIRRAIFPDED